MQVWQDDRQRQREENLRNWNWEEVIDVDMIPDENIIDVDMIPDEDFSYLEEEEEVLIATLYKITSVTLKINNFLTLQVGHGLPLEDLFDELGLTDEDIMPIGVQPNMPNINGQRENVIRVLNRHRVYSVLDESDLMDETDDEE